MPRTPLHRGLLQALSRARRANLEAAGLPPPLVGAVRGWTRRRFVCTAGLAVPALALGGGLPRPAPRREPPRAAEPEYRVAVVGAGLAGLNAAYRLMHAGIQVTLYEASPRVGGRVHTLTDAMGAGLVTELGGEFINSDHADMIGLARELGLKVYNRAEAPATLAYPSTRVLLWRYPPDPGGAGAPAAAAGRPDCRRCVPLGSGSEDLPGCLRPALRCGLP